MNHLRYILAFATVLLAASALIADERLAPGKYRVTIEDILVDKNFSTTQVIVKKVSIETFGRAKIRIIREQFDRFQLLDWLSCTTAPNSKKEGEKPGRQPSYKVRK